MRPLFHRLARIVALFGLLAIGTLALTFWLAPRQDDISPISVASDNSKPLQPVVERLDSLFRSEWREADVRPTAQAEEIAVARRLSLALAGTIPSLEEVRRLDGWPAEDRIRRYLDMLLQDRRTSDYLAERLARRLVGDEEGPFLVFRRRRFVLWLADQLHERVEYDAIVRNLITAEGLWTNEPAVNFVTVTVDDETGQPDPNKVAVRVSRALLGIRLDCAQCHDHPFDDRWKQSDFESLAAYFGRTGLGEDIVLMNGLQDFARSYQVEDRESGRERAVDPKPPFQQEILGEGTPRRQLANWITHRNNHAFARATTNWIWALLLGKPLVEPVDDIPLDGEVHPALDLLADEFIRSGFDWRDLVRAIALSEVFRLQSRSDQRPLSPRQVEHWAAFPLTRLRGEQVAGAIAQSSRLHTIDHSSHLLVRLERYFNQNDFLSRYGDAGDQEMEPRGGTLPQRLLMMNGQIVYERTKNDLFANASTRIASLAPDDPSAIRTAYLAVLTRTPTEKELSHFVDQISGLKNDDRSLALADLYWSLLNTTEFSWNH